MSETQNQNITLELDKICRTCLCEGEMKNLSEEIVIKEESINIKKLLTPFCEIQVDSDSYPNQICTECINEVYRWVKFRQLCQRSDETLKYYFNFTENVTQSEVQDYEEIVIKTELATESENKEVKKESIEQENNGCENEGKTKKIVKKSVPYCKRCDIYFASYEDLTDHKRRIKHPRERNHVCSICKKGFTYSQLKAHMRSHTHEQPFRCEVCGRTFSQKCNLRRHTMTHSGERPHRCDVCGRGFIQSTTLAEHVRTHSGEAPFVCSTCGKGFTQGGQLRAHLRRHRQENGEAVSLYRCEVCERTFQSRGVLKTHLLIHGDKNFLCQHCGRSFVSNAGLQSHSKIHTGVRPYECNVCEKAFSQIGSLKSHMLVHSGIRPYVCKTCNKAFTQRNHLRYHERTHSGARPYTCTVCGKSFALNGTLTVHFRIHTGETPYVCDICNKGFYDSSSMKKHRKGHSEAVVLV